MRIEALVYCGSDVLVINRWGTYEWIPIWKYRWIQDRQNKTR